MNIGDQDFNYIVGMAIHYAGMSQCDKSKRGAVIFTDVEMLGGGFNGPPEPFRCDGSSTCHAACSKICVHAEMSAMLAVGKLVQGADLMHVKVENGIPVASGQPSCWQCSRHILAAGIAGVWLLHAEGWKRYESRFFHKLTLHFNELPKGQ